MPDSGRFFIVNAGAGARDNITLRGLRLLQGADLVIASPAQRDRFAADLAGKEVIDGGHGLFTWMARRNRSEDEARAIEDAMRARINAAHAAGRCIVLLESGDMALFSPYRGYLDAFALLDPVLVPGVSSFNAANALLGVPLLDELDQRLRLSGLEALMQADPACLPERWVLFCMGLDLPLHLDRIAALYPPETEIALVVRAGWPDSEVIRLRVAELDRIRTRSFAFYEVMIYIGLPDRG
ncbi:MAG: hypothetical protein H3C51_09845 [Rubellimicrobium sp.]|nr:hypothetical protein [Rubellimicrobium sp.]